MRKFGILILLLILLVAGACILPSQIGAPQASISSRNQYVLVAPAGSSPTPTPFQPIPPTPTYIPTSNVPVPTATAIPPTPVPPTPVPETIVVSSQGRSWADYAGPSVWPDIEIPAPMGMLAHPEGQVNILLLGSDQRVHDSGFRTDTIQLLTINTREGTVKLTAFPRDLYVYIPGYTVQRINTAMGWGGFKAMQDMMEYNFGVRPDHYVLINLWSFVDVIDSIGGVRVDIGQDLCDQRDAFGWYCVSEGEMWMSGESALWYVRSRHSTSDIARGKRQQEVLDAVFDKLMGMDSLSRAPQLYEIYKNSVTTDLDFETLSSFFPIAYQIAGTHAIDGHSIGYAQVYDWVNASGAMVLVPNRQAVLEVMQQVISQP
jgi:polyisoprenyl-teichoic acid--peptidoglycan teichoic acid transferase